MDREEAVRNIYTFEDTLALYFSNREIQKSVEFSKENIKRYVHNDCHPKLPSASKNGQILFTAEDSLRAAIQFCSAKTAVLDFASAIRPGGGVIMGARGQEEDLCRCTSLYFVLNSDEVKDCYYKKNQTDASLIARSDCLYIPKVQILKAENSLWKRLPENQRMFIDIIVGSAPNLRSKDLQLSNEELLVYHEKRAQAIFMSAIDNNVSNLVLGAFGCGAFRNPPEVVAAAYEQVIPQYKHYFDNIIFAVKCNSSEEPNYKVFSQMVLNLGGTVIDAF